MVLFKTKLILKKKFTVKPPIKVKTQGQIILMNFDEILQQFSKDEKKSAIQEYWDIAASTTTAIIKQTEVFKSLNNSIDSHEKSVKQMEEEINSNTEQGKLQREIRGLKSYLRSAEDDYNRNIDRKIELSQEITNFEAKQAPLLNETAELRARKDEYQKAVDQLAKRLCDDGVTNSSAQEALKDITNQYSKLYLENEKNIQLLFKLREQEIELRNNLVEQQSPTVPVNVDSYKAVLPTIRNKKSESNDFDVNDEDGDNNEQINYNLFDKLQPGTKGQYHNSPVSCLCFANTNPYIASGGEDSVVSIQRTDNFRRVARLCDASRSIMAISFSPSDSLFMTASYDSTIRFYKLPSFTLSFNISDNRDCVNDARFMGEDRVVSCCRDQTVKLYDVNKSTPISSFTSSSIPYSITVLQSQIVTSHHDGKLRCWDFRTHGAPIEIKVHKSSAIQVIGTRQSPTLVSLGTDKAIVVSDMRSKGIIGKVSILKSGLPSEHMQMALNDDSAIIGSTDGSIYNYDLENFKFKNSQKGHTVPVFCVAVKQNLGTMATGDKSGNVMIWNK
ncbi:hypothetical protein TRFO_39741 [Tritrichomonas foetus]|uniref:Uncharacterized protein n=1 Tax=Tritrichomonas foetus TaxID=1144522 RepID=A0A1J4J3W9_9EUKA|nr:hypothetical protein TRFO_39741 [Tritrichomonas foetus]|eukprot:OHS94058.1 hypothetical protein TRFO_39741 [Tritrichomonas foetus]